MEEDIEDIEELKRLFYTNALTQYGKRKLISYYEQRYKELEENYKNQIKHTTILAKALGLKEDALIDEIYAEINKLKANSIPTSVIQNILDELDGKIPTAHGEELLIFDAKKDVLQEIIEGRK